MTRNGPRHLNSHDMRMVQQLAEAMWSVATTETRDIAAWDSPVYKATERAFILAVMQVYNIGPRRARRVRDLLAEYGPHDMLTGTHGMPGVSSYVQFVLCNR